MAFEQRRVSPDSAFTLIELIVATSIMVGVFAAAYGALSTALSTRRILEQRSDLLGRGRAALEIIAHDLRVAVPASEANPFVGMERKERDFRSDNLDFTALCWQPRLPGESDRCEVSYFVDRDPETKRLNLYRRRDPSPDVEPFAGGVREIIARDIAAIRFEYYDGTDWVETWGAEDQEDFVDDVDEPDPEAADADTEPGALKGSAPPSYGVSGLPEAVRVTIAFAKDAREVGEIDPDEALDLDALHVVQKVVRLELTERPDPTANDTGPVSTADGTPEGNVIDNFGNGEFFDPSIGGGYR